MMRFTHVALAAIALAPAAASAQTTLTTTTYSQDFDTLAATGSTGTALPAGFAFVESGANANGSYGIGTGSSNAGNTYSFGSAGSTERAFGSVASGNLTPAQYGFLFTNGLNSTITGFDLSYVGEQWRLTNSTDDGLTFQYSTDATSLTNGTWTTVSALNFLPVFTNGTAAGSALDGNLAANQRLLSATISGLSIAAGGNFAFRWTDFDSTGSDQGLAIDNFSLSATTAVTAVPEPATWAMMMLGFGAMGAVVRKRARTNTRIRFA